MFRQLWKDYEAVTERVLGTTDDATLEHLASQMKRLASNAEDFIADAKFRFACSQSPELHTCWHTLLDCVSRLLDHFNANGVDAGWLTGESEEDESDEGEDDEEAESDEDEGDAEPDEEG